MAQTSNLLEDIYDHKITDLDYYRANYPHFYFNNLSKITEHIQHASLVKGPAHRALDVEDPEWAQVSYWWNHFVLEKQRCKKKNLFVWGPPNVGKSTRILGPMIKQLQAYHILEDTQFWLPFYNNYAFAFCDEFKGVKPVAQLNEFMSPTPMIIRNFGGTTIKDQDIPVILCSNQNPRDLYGDTRETWKAFKARFTIVYLEEINTIF